MEDTIKLIIENAKAGDEDAFNQLFQLFYGRAYAIAWQITKNDADAKDAVQETFLSIHASIKDLRQPENFYSWMRMIVISKCNKIFRKKHDLPFDPAMLAATSKEEYRSYMTPHDHNDYMSEQEVLRMLIGKLKPRYQIIIEYVYLRQLKIDETAQLLHLSAGTVKTRLHRARKDLYHEIRKFEKENHRKLDFHSIGSMIGLTTSLFYYARCCTTNLKQFVHILRTNAVCTASGVALGVVLVTGGAFVVQDSVFTHPLTSSNEQSISNIVPTTDTSTQLPSNAFPATAYFDKTIYTNKDAYYICVNFAINEEEMNHKTKEELQAIRPLYESLKEEKSEYWTRLVKEGWVKLYEQSLMKT